MRYIDIGGVVVPKHCKYGPRPAEGIVFNNYEWWSITDHLVKEQREREIAAVQRAKEEAKKEISYDMTKNWSNTLASVKTQSNQKRLEKMEREKQDKIDKYNEIMKARAQEKKEMLANVRKMIFEEGDAAKTITSAVGLSLALEERKKQIEVKNLIREKEAKKQTELELEYKKTMEAFARDQLQERIKVKEKKAIQRKYLDEQIEEMKKRKQEEAEESAEEKKDLINMKIETEKIAHCNTVEKNYRKEFAARYMKKTEAQLEFQRKLRLEQEEEDEINKIYIDYDNRLRKERKAREEKTKNEQVERRIRIAERLAEKLKEASRKEEEWLKAAADAKEREAQKELERKKELEQLALKSLLDGKRKSEQRKARQEYEKKEEKKWELMQQYRSAEINNEWREAERMRKEEFQKRVKAGYDCQRKQQEEKRARELQEEQIPLIDVAAEREELLKYCQETMDFAKEHSLPENPIQGAISKMKKIYGIHDKNEPQQAQDSEQQNRRKVNPRSYVTGCYCFKY